MSGVTAPTHQSLYRNVPLLIGGLQGPIALLAAGVAAALHIVTTGDELLPLVFGPPVADGLGFWNRPPGLVLLGIALLASLALAILALWGLWNGATARHRAGEAAAILVMLPVGVAWMLRRSWRRRRSVLRAARGSRP